MTVNDAHRQPLPIPHSRAQHRRQFIAVFVLCFVTWVLLVGGVSPIDTVWGTLVSLVVAAITYRAAAIDLPRWVLHPRRWWALVRLIGVFVVQLVVQNITLSLRVLSPQLPIRPGIVAVRTDLRSDFALTLLGGLVTLTPDTVTLDIDAERGLIFVHWIAVRTTDPEQARQQITAEFEQRISAWLV